MILILFETCAVRHFYCSSKASMPVLLLITFSSTVRKQSIQEAVELFLSDIQTVHGDTCCVEFADEFLKEHVKSISIVSETDLSSKCGQV